MRTGATLAGPLAAWVRQRNLATLAVRVALSILSALSGCEIPGRAERPRQNIVARGDVGDSGSGSRGGAAGTSSIVRGAGWRGCCASAAYCGPAAPRARWVELAAAAVLLALPLAARAAL